MPWGSAVWYDKGIRSIVITHTIATLEVTIHTYKEIAAKLRAAGYDHAFGADGTIDMQGIGLVEEKPKPEPIPIGCNRHRVCPMEVERRIRECCHSEDCPDCFGQ